MEFSLAAFLQVVFWMFGCAIKFFMSAPLVPVAGYSFTQSVLISFGGGSIGVLFFYYSGSWAIDQLSRIKLFRRKKPKKVMTRRNKTIVSVKHRFGIVGLAVLTPSLLSIPIGSLVAARFYRAEKRTIPIMLAAVLAWSILLTALSSYIVDLFGLHL